MSKAEKTDSTVSLTCGSRPRNTDASKKNAVPDFPTYAKPDRNLIIACVSYTAAIAAFSGAYKGDPDGDSATASPVADTHYSDAMRHLAAATKIKAQTMSGLAAKARCMPFVLEDNQLGGSEQVDAFMEAFSADVLRFASEAVSAQWDAAQKGGAQ